MRNKLIRIFCAALTLAMIFVFSGCGVSEQEKLLGTWEGEVDMSPVFNETFTSTLEDEISAFLTFDGVSATVLMTFREDGTYSIRLEESSVDDMVSAMKEDISAGLEAYLVQLFAGMGTQMTIDEIMEVMETTMEEMVDEYITDDLIQNMKAGFSGEGRFEAENGRLYLSAGVDLDAASGTYDSYTLKGDILTLKASENTDEMAAALYPMVFKKVS